MKLRTKNKAALAILGLGVLPALASLLFPHNDVVLYGCISACGAFLLSLAPSLMKSYLPSHWGDSVVARSGDEYPVRVVRAKADYGFQKDISVRLVVAGVNVEVNSEHIPSMFGIPPHVDHVVNIEDCMLLSDDDLLDLLNDLYETEYYIEK